MQGCEEKIQNISDNRFSNDTNRFVLDSSEKDCVEEFISREILFQTAVQHAPNGFAIVSPEGRWMNVNPSFSKITGYSETELLATDFQSITHPEDLEGGLKKIENLLGGTEDTFSMEKRYKHKNGNYIWVQSDISLVRKKDKTPNYFVTHVQEISDRKKAEKDLRDSEERFRQLAETIDEVFWIKDADFHNLLYVSPAYERIFGRPLAELFVNPESWLDSVHPDDFENVRDTIHKQREAGSYNAKFRILHPDGAERWIRIRSFPVLGSEGQIDKIVGVARDITKQHELEKQLAHSQRMESVGSLAGGVAHDFNNILTVIMGFASLLEQNPSNPQKVLQSVKVILKTAERGASLVKQLLTLARKAESVFQPLVINDLIQEALNIARSTFPKSILISSEIQPDPIRIHADYTQIHQIFVNLILNAKDAMPNGGNLSVKMREAEPNEIVTNERSEDFRKYVLLEIADTGTGMDPETKSKIFDPFFTTKGLGKGTGLGLALVYGIVESHRGFITVDTTLHEGTKFRVFLPIESKNDTNNSGVEKIESERIAEQKNILLVEDEEMIREPLKNYLFDQGYNLLVAKDGVEALSVFSQNKEKIQAVICDFNLPKMNGLEVLQTIRSQKPEAILILASGYIDPQVRHEAEKIGLKSIIQKPYRFETILKMIQEI